MHRIHFSPDAKKVSSRTMIFLLNLATLIHSTMPLTYLASFSQTGLQTNAQRLPGDSSVFVHHSSTFPSPTKGTSFSKLKRKTHKQSYTSISPQGFCKLYMTQCKMQTKQKHPLQFYFKFLNNFPCLHGILSRIVYQKPSIPSRVTALPAGIEASAAEFQAYTLVHKGTRSKKPIQVFVGLRSPLSLI